MTSDANLVQQGRAAIDTVTEKVRSDPQFAARFKEEPVAVLLEAGAPEAGMVDILRETGFGEDEVKGFGMTIGISTPTTLSPRPTLGGTPTLGPRPGGGVMDCSGTCNCSSSCLFTF
jgi:hypothetical protein